MNLADFNSIQISVASPEKVLDWSYGEVLKPETINYRTQKPERDGLFDERIFGPTKDWECYCGKYKKIRYKGVICDKCGVEVTRSSVRRERMGHIELAAAVAHIWYVRGVPSILSLILDVPVSDLEKVIYFAGFIVLEVDSELRDDLLRQLETEYEELRNDKTQPQAALAELDINYKATKQELASLAPKMILSEMKYQQMSLRYGGVIRVGIGAEAIFELLRNLDVDTTIKALTERAEDAGESTKRRLLKRIQVLSEMRQAVIKPEWLILQRLPVIPPDLRPMVQLDGGRYAASDLNDLYRRVLNRNNRLKKLLSQGAPEVICRNEKRMLQEAVDALIDNSARRSRAVSTGATQRRLRSLSDMLRGKQGRFRQNLLGKRVDYSGRSVIVVGPELKLNQCGLPKMMALELFKPFVISKLVSEGYIQNVKNAQRLIERGAPEVWDVLERVTSEKFVMLNRAPTLHRLGIQAFRPVLIEGKAIQLHPLVCQAYNADFDGDQMAVHVPLSEPSLREAKEIMLSSKNLLKPASGEPVVSPRLDMVFGVFYMTSFEDGVKGEGKAYSGKNEAILAYHMRDLHVRAKIKVKMSLKEDGESEIVETSVGRILFNNVLPRELRFNNETQTAKSLKQMVQQCFTLLGTDVTAELVDRIKFLGFEHALKSGMTIAMSDIYTPGDKPQIIAEATKTVNQIQQFYTQGLIADSDRRLQTIRVWEQVRDTIGKTMLDGFDKNSPVYIATSSGARGSASQLNQVAGMVGMVVNPSGAVIETPVISSFKEGLTELEYFISTHGARKGRADTALRTSDAGYLTRRLVDVAQDVTVSMLDCKSTIGLEIRREESDALDLAFGDRLVGRTALEPIVIDGSTVTPAGEEISVEVAAAITKSSLPTVTVRSPIGCQSEWGICQFCYGRDLATGKLVKQGEVVGIMAAQAIGEPGTQLTLRTFHLGGVAGEDITTGLPRVEELFEARTPKSLAIMSDLDGTVHIRDRKTGRIIEIISSELRQELYEVPTEHEIIVKNGEIVRAKQTLASMSGKRAIRSSIAGKARVLGQKITITSLEPMSHEYPVTAYQSLKVRDGDTVHRGQAITEGHLDLQRMLKYLGPVAVQRYIIQEIQSIYLAQGQDINDKHIEIILRQMFSKSQVLNSADSKLLAGQIVDWRTVEKERKRLEKRKKSPPIMEPLIFGVTRVALTTDSFLSAASFQETTSVLINAAVRGAVDPLRGLKENVIIGRLIPAGTGYRKMGN
ncbi:MAG: DNA-directed RNA polymerase subunit beta' [Patescibacteria group bacterium]